MLEVVSLGRWTEYDAWANLAVCQALAATNDTVPKAAAQLAHLLIVEKVWMERLRNRCHVPYSLFPAWSAAHCTEMARMLAGLWLELLPELERRLDVPLPYHTTDGEPCEHTPRSIMTHVALHSAHHRGQVCACLEAAGHEAPLVDFIRFERGL